MGTFGRSFGLQWHLTDQCDQRCKHCYIWSKKEKVKLSKKKLNLEQCVSVVDKFFQFCESFKIASKEQTCSTGGCTSDQAGSKENGGMDCSEAGPD